MQFHFSGLRQFWAVVLVLTIMTGSACRAGELEFSPTEQAWLDVHPVIRMSVDTGYGPYTFLDVKGQLQGVAVEFFAEIERLLGIRFDIISNLSWPQQMQAVRECRLDAVATVVKLPEREAFIEFTEIYLPTPLVIMTRKETPPLHSLKGLQQLSLSLVKGYSSSKQLIAQFPDLVPRYVATPIEGLRLVASGATDAYVGVLGVNSFLTVRNGITNLKVNAAFNMVNNGQRFGVRKDWPQLARLLDKALITITDERRNIIFQQWLPRHDSTIERIGRPGYVTQLFPWLLGCLGFALLSYFILFIFNRRLRKAVETRTQELSEANEKLHESEERYRRLFEDSPISLWEEDFSDIKKRIDRLRSSGITDFRTYFQENPKLVHKCAGLVKILDINKITLEMFQAESKKELLENLSKIFRKGSYEVFQEQLISLTEGKYLFVSEAVNQTLQGNKIHVDLQLRIMSGYEDTWLKVLVSLTEVTKRVQAEKELKKYHNYLEELVEKRTKELKEKTGKIEESSKALTYLLEDVNESREALQKVNMEYVAANQELKEFAYIVSHDLKAPLRAISQLTHWISQDYSHLFDDDGKLKMELIIKRAKRMGGLIDGVLQYSRIGRVREKEEHLDLNLLVKEVIENIAPPDNIQIIVENSLPVVLRDSIRMEQVFQNLIGNAIKFMDKDEGLIKVDCVDKGTFWEFSISDNGPGIDKRYHDKIFQIFQTLTARDTYESTGIGLTLVKKNIGLYGGSVWVESQKDHGATFFFTLPKKGEKYEKL